MFLLPQFLSNLAESTAKIFAFGKVRTALNEKTRPLDTPKFVINFRLEGFCVGGECHLFLVHRQRTQFTTFRRDVIAVAALLCNVELKNIGNCMNSNKKLMFL